MSSAPGTVEHVEAGVSGHVGRYDVFVRGDVVAVVEDTDEPRTARERVEGLGAWLAQVGDLALGWAAFEDGMEVVYLYDKDDDLYGYAVNLDVPHFSEWGYAPFRDP